VQLFDGGDDFVGRYRRGSRRWRYGGGVPPAGSATARHRCRDLLADAETDAEAGTEPGQAAFVRAASGIASAVWNCV
jgi:hypothetical protein